MLLLAGSIQGIYAQKTEKKEKFNPNTPLFEELTDVKKKTDKFNLYLNMQGSFDAHFQSVVFVSASINKTRDFCGFSSCEATN